MIKLWDGAISKRLLVHTLMQQFLFILIGHVGEGCITCQDVAVHWFRFMLQMARQ
jgi:hypothetical protein